MGQPEVKKCIEVYGLAEYHRSRDQAVFCPLSVETLLMQQQGGQTESQSYKVGYNKVVDYLFDKRNTNCKDPVM